MCLNHTTSTHAQAGEFRDDDRFPATQPSTDPTAAGGSGAERSEAEPAHEPPPSGASFYLESDRNTVPTKEADTEPPTTVEEHLELHPCRCKCRFCKHCSVGLGIKLCNRLKPILKTFTGLQMWTFTIDPKLFRNHEEAYRYVMGKRCLSKLIAALHEAGHLHSKRYFYVVEWHKNGGAHFHVLLDTSFVPFQRVCDLWNANRPAWAGPVEGKRPGFGSIRFSPEEHVFFEPEHAAHYACKYLIGQPKNGFPAWVLDSKRIRMFSTSRGFWGESQARPENETTEAAPSHSRCLAGDGVECCCPECQGEVEAVTDDEASDLTIRERLQRCRQEAVVLHVTTITKADGEATKRYEFVKNLKRPFREIVAAMGKAEKECPYVQVTETEIQQWEWAHELAQVEAIKEAKAA